MLLFSFIVPISGTFACITSQSIDMDFGCRFLFRCQFFGTISITIVMINFSMKPYWNSFQRAKNYCYLYTLKTLKMIRCLLFGFFNLIFFSLKFKLWFWLWNTTLKWYRRVFHQVFMITVHHLLHPIFAS